MINCNNSGAPNGAMLGDCDPINIGCVPRVVGMPTSTPLQDQLPIAYDTSTGCLWYYICEDNGWVQFCPGSICDLNQVDIGVLTGICEALNIPVTYSLNGTCVEGTVTLQTLADALITCIELPSPGGLTPVVLTGRSEFENGRCYRIRPGENEGVRLIDSLTSNFDGNFGPLVFEWSFTNPTNNSGVLQLNSRMWTTRYSPHTTTPAHVMFMLGQRDRVNSYSLDPSQPSVAPNLMVPHNRIDVSYDIRPLPAVDVYPFWGNWFPTIFPFAPGTEVAADLDETFVLAAGETIELAARIAVGFQSPILVADAESGWMGVSVKYVFNGHNS